MLVAQYYRKASDIENRRAYAKAVEHASSNIEQSLDRPLDDFDFWERLILREIMRITKGVD